MRFRNLLLAAAIAVTGLAAGVSGQTMIDGVKVDLPYTVRVSDDVVLEPGEYEIRRASQNQDQVLRIYSNDKMRYETHVITVPALETDTPQNTKVVLHHIGDDYYFDKIWIQGKDYGYEFVLPERARALKRELAEVPATYVPQSQTSPATTEDRAASEAATTQAARSTQPAPSTPAQSTAPAESAQSAQSAQRSQSTPAATDQSAQSQVDQQAQAERDRQAELAAQAETSRTRPIGAVAEAGQDREAQAQRDANVDGRIAQVQTQTNAAQQSQQRQSNSGVLAEGNQRLPATSANWLGWILGGAALITLSAIVRSKASE